MKPRSVIPDLELGQTLLDYLLHPEKLKGYVEQLLELERSLIDKLGAVETLEEAERRLAQATATKAEADTIRRQAEADQRTAKIQVDTAATDADRVRDQAERDATRIRTEAQEMLAAATATQNAATVATEKLDRRIKAVEQRETDAMQATEEAEAIKADYRRRLAAIQGIAQGA